MKINLRKPAIVAAATAGLLAVGGGVAFAYWTATGSGSGTATTAASSQNLTVTQAPFAGSALTPGGAAQDVSGSIGNPNTFPVQLTSLTAAVAVDAAHASAGCQAGWYTVTNLSTAASVAANSSAAFTGKVAMTDPGTNQDACKGATVTITYTVNA
ncbi:hypothetical protein Daura_16205 [Dactylosporangium aurantiacum]|uniref:Uncharacterized protein n=1 Tax=Dactylosporangium aurantiacum TaxID=35754 RepID=A0A9Q9IKZ1_9ACTN|nr:hypothetical protein [Dactylosporangium aurantiacum]MDG6103049.1 hypothetical protein [Dactylosporangium aurantiacum]UWZ57561.1 hypothetical protein Daura_16205 [Dactylosporangium aurantiacum]